MENKYSYLYYMCCLIFLLGCKQKANKVEMTESENSFLEFYEKFHADSIFQMSHIDFPLLGKPAGGEMIDTSGHYFWQKEDWRMHHAIDFSKETQYKRYVENLGSLIIEKICEPQGYCLERRFALEKGAWNLIYYAAMQEENANK